MAKKIELRRAWLRLVEARASADRCDDEAVSAGQPSSSHLARAQRAFSLLFARVKAPVTETLRYRDSFRIRQSALVASSGVSRFPVSSTSHRPNRTSVQVAPIVEDVERYSPLPKSVRRNRAAPENVAPMNRAAPENVALANQVTPENVAPTNPRRERTSHRRTRRRRRTSPRRTRRGRKTSPSRIG